MLRGAYSDVNAWVSDTGKCNPNIFRRYLNEHFLPHSQRLDTEPILVLMDGSRSHMFVGLSEWGRRNNVIFSFIPAHTTHLLQPLEVECSEALQNKYESICRKHLRITSNPCISRNSICELACVAFSKVMSRQIVMNSFKKAGVFPDVSSDESGDEMGNDDLPYRTCSPKSDDDSVHNDEADEIVFTGDLVVGHNQEVTEDEVITTQEVVLSEDNQSEQVVITSDGQLVLGPGAEAVVSPEGHLVIQGGDIFVTDKDNAFSHFQLLSHPSSSDTENSSPVKMETLVGEPLSDSKCIINNGRIISASGRLDSTSALSSIGLVDTSFNSSDCDFSSEQGSRLMEELTGSAPLETIIKAEVLEG